MAGEGQTRRAGPARNPRPWRRALTGGQLRCPCPAAATYLAQVLAEKDRTAFLVALKDVVETTGGMSVMAKRVGLKHPSLYKVLSKRGNPTLEILQAILEALGLRVTLAAANTE
jgi:probable addiction module antidote protein